MGKIIATQSKQFHIKDISRLQRQKDGTNETRLSQIFKRRIL